MKRTNIEFLIGWLDALRRDDRKTLLASLEPEVVWQGLKPDWVCRGREAVVDVFGQHRDAGREMESLELIGAEGHAVLHARGPGVREIEIELEDGIYNVFAIWDGSVLRIDDFADRAAAFAAAGIEKGHRGVSPRQRSDPVRPRQRPRLIDRLLPAARLLGTGRRPQRRRSRYATRQRPARLPDSRGAKAIVARPRHSLGSADPPHTPAVTARLALRPDRPAHYAHPHRQAAVR